MVFNSPLFLFLFFPLFAGAYFLSSGRRKKYVLIIFSLLFYFWADRNLVLLLLLSCFANYGFGWLIGKGHRKTGLYTSLTFNILLLFYFKYFIALMKSAGISTQEISAAGSASFLSNVALPLGISFYTFRAISYIMDVYHGKTEQSRDLAGFLAYFTMFPLMVAGPIVRYDDIRHQLPAPDVSLQGIAGGMERIIIGLAKKVILADTFAAVTNLVSNVPLADLPTGWAWVGIAAFTLEIYYDFSGYTDIAIGIGMMIGFNFRENFNFPYVARNIREFWRRWHISLSTWLRDYIFLPLAYLLSRKLPAERYLRLKTDSIIYLVATAITFFICGMWHGAGVQFIAWGIYFAVFLIVEQLFLARLMKKIWIPLQHGYTMLVVMGSWVIFKSDNLDEAISYFEKMFVISYGSPAVGSYLKYFIFNRETLFMTLVALVFATPAYPKLKALVFHPDRENQMLQNAFTITGICILGLLFIISVAWMAENTYNPFIYRRF